MTTPVIRKIRCIASLPQRLRLAGQRTSMCYVTVNLMTFDKQSNGRRIEIESYM